MKAYCASFSDETEILVGAPNLAAAAKKAKAEETPKKELVRVEKTDKLIL